MLVAQKFFVISKSSLLTELCIFLRGHLYLKKDLNIQWIIGITAMELIGDFILKSAMAYNQLVIWPTHTVPHTLQF